MLTDHGFTWEYRSQVSPEAFDKDKSLKNQARLGEPLDPDTLDRYEAALLHGDPFPAVIAYEPTSGNKALVIADGNHRFAVHAKHNKKIHAYVIRGAKSQAITMLTFEANTKHGLSTSKEERIHHALWLAEGGVPLADAATRMALTTAELRKASNLVEAGHRADDTGIIRTAWDTFPDSTKLRLHQVSTDEGFAELVDLAYVAHLNTLEVGKIVSEVNEQRSSSRQLTMLKRLRSDMAERLQVAGMDDRGPRGRQGRSPRQAMGMALGQVVNMPAPRVLTELLTDDERKEYLGRTDEALARLTELRAALAG